jgi:seryl-tRNA synthetase
MNRRFVPSIVPLSGQGKEPDNLGGNADSFRPMFLLYVGWRDFLLYLYNSLSYCRQRWRNGGNSLYAQKACAGMEENMLDLKMVRENPEIVKQNIRNKFQENKLPLVDEVIALDAQSRNAKQEADNLRFERNKISKQIGSFMAAGKKEEAEEMKKQVTVDSERLAELEALEMELDEKIKKIMMIIPNIIDPSVPIGKDDSENVEVQQYGDPFVPAFDIPYHTEIMEKFSGIDLDSARKVAGNGFYYLLGDIARLHSSIISYARDFMINRGFTYCIPPFMIRSEVVTGVMSFAEMDAMMYKIEGEDLYLIGTSEHSMIGKFIDNIIPSESLPQALTSYSPCFRKEKGAHGLEERGVYRIHQFEKQEMIVVCKPEDSKQWFDKLWQNTVDLFRTLDIPVRTLECCSGDLADLKVKSFDVEAWSPRQKKYFEVGSCSNLGDAQARRLKIRVVGEDGKYFAHTLNNTVVAPPRMLIAFLENNLNADGTVNIPTALQPYMGGQTIIK